MHWEGSFEVLQSTGSTGGKGWPIRQSNVPPNGGKILIMESICAQWSRLYGVLLATEFAGSIGKVLLMFSKVLEALGARVSGYGREMHTQTWEKYQ
jgi:hypothetical protein